MGREQGVKANELDDAIAKLSAVGDYELASILSLLRSGEPDKAAEALLKSGLATLEDGGTDRESENESENSGNSGL
jgi:hypothetical protein